ncbi:phage tail protein [Halodesulfovibrio aestuarii]|uniref:phage tail protein n=1 Tax=Halodesulfovibrio aestuarii TaxID=126333 RepID=UPI003D334399
MPDFYTVVTDTGLQELGLATTQGQSFSLTQAVVGDGNGLAIIPNKGMETLVNEVWRGNVAGIKVDPDDPNTLIFEFAIPADTGGFTIREVGLLDESGKLFCIGNFPDTEKPVAADGSVRDLVVRLPLHFENADVVNLVINAAIALATKQDVFDHNADPQAHRLATTAETGFVRLATDEEHVVHQRKTVAATPWGVWKLIEAVKSDAVDLTSSVRLATSQAVKSVMDALSLHTGNTSMHVPPGHIYPVPFPPNELPAHHYVPNGEGLLKTSEAGKTLLSMSAGYKAAHRVTENETHVFLPNVFDSRGKGYFQRFVDGVMREVGTLQASAAPEIQGQINQLVIGVDTWDVEKEAVGAFSAEIMGGYDVNTSLASELRAIESSANDKRFNLHVKASGSSEVYGRNGIQEIIPENYGFTPVIYLPPLGGA